MLKATQIYKSYQQNEILHGVDLTVSRGEFLSIMGESGSGKSTLLSILAGNLRPDSGSVILDGKEISTLREKELAALRRTRLGFVYQSLNLLPTLNGEDNILLPLYLDRADTVRGRARIQELAGLLHIEKVLHAFPDTMSGGERQRVAIARALIHDPSILMLDEPTGSLDSASTEQVMKLLCHINAELGVTVLQVTHSEAAAAYGTRIIRLCDGRVVEQ
ncbi:MAG: ABC transporter ATP-binding protein [Clostridia bacterium]|nr:ABC transporter ATP-binding protein [Clostridia bacterium]